MLPKGFLSQLFPGFDMRRFLPFLELLIEFLVFKARALFLAPFPARAVKLPALIAQIQQAGIALMNRLVTEFHANILSNAALKTKPEYSWPQ